MEPACKIDQGLWSARIVHAKGFTPKAHQISPPVPNHNLDYAKLAGWDGKPMVSKTMTYERIPLPERSITESIGV